MIVGDMIPERLAQAQSFGCETIDLTKGDPKDQIEQILGVPEVDAAVDAVGFEAKGHGSEASHEAPATVLNSIMDVTRVAGKLGIPGLYVTGDPGGVDEAAKQGSLSIRIGLGWAKSHSFATGQCPVMKYHHGLMQMILNDRAQIAKAVNATIITLDEAPQGYRHSTAERPRSSCSTHTASWRPEALTTLARPDTRPRQTAPDPVASARGLRRISLDCGSGEAFVPGRSLYGSAGIVPCGPFGEYAATRDNVFMTRLLG